MAQTVTVEIQGLRELDAKLKKMGSRMARRSAGRATGKAAKVIKDAAKRQVIANPSVETGSLLGAIVSKKLPKRETPDTAAHIVTVRVRESKRATKRANRRKQKTAPYANIVEFGSVKMAAEPFLRPAFDSQGRAAQDVMVDTLRREVEEAAK